MIIINRMLSAAPPENFTSFLKIEIKTTSEEFVTDKQGIRSVEPSLWSDAYYYVRMLSAITMKINDSGEYKSLGRESRLPGKLQVSLQCYVLTVYINTRPTRPNNSLIVSYISRGIGFYVTLLDYFDWMLMGIEIAQKICIRCYSFVRRRLMKS